MSRYLVYACAHYVGDYPRTCVGIGLSLEGAQQIIRDYRRFGMLGAQCDIVTVQP